MNKKKKKHSVSAMISADGKETIFLIKFKFPIRTVKIYLLGSCFHSVIAHTMIAIFHLTMALMLSGN